MIDLPSEFEPSTTFPHHPLAQGIVVIPGSESTCVALYRKGSLQLPNSPRDLHWKHLLKIPIR